LLAAEAKRAADAALWDDSDSDDGGAKSGTKSRTKKGAKDGDKGGGATAEERAAWSAAMDSKPEVGNPRNQRSETLGRGIGRVERRVGSTVASKVADEEPLGRCLDRSDLPDVENPYMVQIADFLMFDRDFFFVVL
jgi:hypothetical protein